MTAPLLQVDGLVRHFSIHKPLLARLTDRGPKQVVRAVDGLSFGIERGQTLSLVGESGCGKSTVAKLIMGLQGVTAGTLRFDGQPLTDDRPADLRRRMQMIFQDPYASLNPRWRVARIIAEPLRTYGMIPDAKALRAEVDRLLEFVGLAAGDGDKFPHEFSGGQRQRISIARAISTKPEFLVCDEPTSSLDVSVQAQILNLMRQLQRDLGLTYLFISHDLAVVNYISDWIGVMYLGRLVELAPAQDILSRPKHPYTRLLLETVPDISMKNRDAKRLTGEVPNPITPPPGCHFHPRCPMVQPRCLTEAPKIRLLDQTRVACHFAEIATATPSPAEPAPAEPVHRKAG
jgi:peptide/nickel transport system ATP-binding protein